MAALFEHAELRYTEARNTAVRLTRQALQQGHDPVVAVGGDGTIHEVVNGFFADGKRISPQARLGIVPMGTGGDFVRTLQANASDEKSKSGLERALVRIKSERAWLCDVGRIQCAQSTSDQLTCYFINIADAGFGGKLAERVNRSPKTAGPFLAYLAGLLRTLVSYVNKPVRVELDGRQLPEQKVNSVVIANGRFFGGGMWVAPDADLDDGWFDVIIIGDVSRREVLANVRRLYTGTLAVHPKVKIYRAKQVVLSSPEPQFIEADGELVGALPARFDLLPNALHLIW